jgi:hypothetical protein
VYVGPHRSEPLHTRDHSAVAVGVVWAERADWDYMTGDGVAGRGLDPGVPNMEEQVVSQPAVAARSGTIGSASTCVQSR